MAMTTPTEYPEEEVGVDPYFLLDLDKEELNLVQELVRAEIQVIYNSTPSTELATRSLVCQDITRRINLYLEEA